MGQLIFHKTELNGAFIVEPKPREDERGKFARVFCKREFSEIGHEKEFVQFNHSVNKVKGTVRGMHFQRSPHREIKLVRCIRGSVFDVIVDLRSGSATYQKWFGEIISETNMKMMYIPEGFAHGFQVLEENSELLYHHTAYYTPEAEGGINPTDALVDIKWPVPISLLSDRDRSFEMMNSNFKAL
jgi:dTDP-4-dehydrorhamnose 3,5-epimerase